MGQPLPDQLQGTSRRAVLEERSTLADNVFIEWNGHNNGFGDVIGQVILPDYMPSGKRYARGGYPRHHRSGAHGDHARRLEVQLQPAGRV